ncbi:MAG: bifunctional [glutamate--ammonia ligase]-adenylyl-L-tyrosine phosphorylase/[glutamate--ammonia-ligase] adenylyltransferase, partial [Planctomycetia bacterium]|nr:bifunctional [glutamate--ammonia ligase]-adenylyl-L-tyrosine phosphorylase/[glutamate--ammonia-ligase] adenylyltransferase [Planctomycetia bacterium]
TSDDSSASICDQLAARLSKLSDPDMALTNLARFVVAARSPLALGSLFERDHDALRILLQIFSTSQHLSDLLVTDPDAYDLLRMTEGQPVARDALLAEIVAELSSLVDERAAMAALRRYKRRETLRISYGDIIREQPLATVTAQISHLADAITEAAVRFARRQLEIKLGVPRVAGGRPARFVLLAMGKLGGVELNYSSDIDLIALFEADGQTDGPRSKTNAEFFERLVRDVVRLLSEKTELGQTYRVDLRLRPEGSSGPVAMSIDSALRYYDVVGRTWERQAYVKARPAAGDLDLGQEFLAKLEPWIYRRYLSLADIVGIKALKRRIEQRTRQEGAEQHDVKTGHGGIRDIEFVIQFLQLLNGGDLKELRGGHTLEALGALERVGCLTSQERALLETNYIFLRKLEHRLQIMFDLQTHALPREPEEIRKLAIRMDFADAATSGGKGTDAGEVFMADYRQKTVVNRRILDHLLHDAFGDDARTEPEVDLVLDPDPPREQIAAVLGRYGFRDLDQAYRNLMELSREKIRFLSTRRCRMFLAAIAPRLLAALGEQVDPDSTLVNLVKVSESLGGKGVLWELFSFNPPTLKLYVELCATSPYLSGLLTSNPGMIDELMDSLMLDKLSGPDELLHNVAELCRGAENPEPILHSFKNAQQLRVGVRDILGKEDIQTTMGALSDVAQALLRQITEIEYRRLAVRLGEPVVALGPRAGQICELAILAMGKFGGRELNYHSDLDIVFLYEAEGGTQHRRTSRSGQVTSNRHFFSELGQKIIKVASQLGPLGRLYQVDTRLRPTGRNGPLATSLGELARYFAEGEGQLWERLALCRARVVLGNAEVARETLAVVAQAAFDHPWQPGDVEEIIRMRQRLVESAERGDLKRAAGGIVDIEFLSQMLQLRHGHNLPSVRQPNTLDALAALAAEGCIEPEDQQFLARSYRLLRATEARLRLMHTTARDDLPDDPQELEKLARALGRPSGEALLEECHVLTRRNRELFERYCEQAAAARA